MPFTFIPLSYFCYVNFLLRVLGVYVLSWFMWYLIHWFFSIRMRATFEIYCWSMWKNMVPLFLWITPSISASTIEPNRKYWSVVVGSTALFYYWNCCLRYRYSDCISFIINCSHSLNEDAKDNLTGYERFILEITYAKRSNFIWIWFLGCSSCINQKIANDDDPVILCFL